jgi:hypothetical protein
MIFNALIPYITEISYERARLNKKKHDGLSVTKENPTKCKSERKYLKIHQGPKF